jgi:hypothetical protein
VADLGTLTRDLVKVWQAIHQLTAIVTKQGEHIAQLSAALALFGGQSERAGADLNPLATGIGSVDITWPNPFPDTAYGVYPAIVVPGANMGQCFVEVSAKTTTGATIAVRNTSGGVLTTALLDVLAIRT